MKSYISDAEVVGVVHLEQYKSCLRCKARVEPANRGLGRCSKEECKMLQKYNKCTSYISAKLLFQRKSIVLSLNAHGQMVRDIVAADGLEEINKELLLQKPILSKVKYNLQYTITEIEH